MSDHAEKVATSLDIRREIVRKTRRRHVDHIHEELNITDRHRPRDAGWPVGAQRVGRMSPGRVLRNAQRYQDRY